MANYAVEKLSAKTAAVFYQTGNDYSEGLMNAFVEKAAELGLRSSTPRHLLRAIRTSRPR